MSPGTFPVLLGVAGFAALAIPGAGLLLLDARGLVREATAKLDALCRHRFTAELRDGVLAPLAGAAQVDGHEQRRLEESARALRGIDLAGRLVGGAAAYDALLAEARDSVRQATEAGSLGPVRAARLGEILAG